MDLGFRGIWRILSLIGVTVLFLLVFVGFRHQYGQSSGEAVGSPDQIIHEARGSSFVPGSQPRENNILKDSPLFGVEEISYSEISDVPSWMNAQAKRGVGIVGIDVMENDDAETAFKSGVLEDIGFSFDGEYDNFFSDLLNEAKRYNITVMVMLEGLAHIKSNFLPHSKKLKANKITPSSVGRLIQELGVAAKQNGVHIAVNEEAFEDDAFIDAITEAAREYNITYVHFFDDLKCRPDIFLSEDYAYYPKNAEGNPGDKNYLEYIIELGTYSGELGNLNLMYGSAQACGKDAGFLTAGNWGMGDKTHQNLALFRAVQYAPKMYFFVIGESYDGVMPKIEQEYVEHYDYHTLDRLVGEYARNKKDARKPVFNYILDRYDTLSEDADIADYYTNSLLSSTAAITNAAASAGMDIFVTTTPMHNADFYYVLTPGAIYNGEEGKDMSADAAKLVDKKVPVFYQVAEEIPDMENFNRLKKALGISGNSIVNYEATTASNPLPRYALFSFPAGGKQVTYRGYAFEPWEKELAGSFASGQGIFKINVGQFRGRTLLSSAGGEPLIIRQGRQYFVNGGYLHLDASSVLANLFAKELGKQEPYNAPSFGYFVNGRERAAFYSAYDEDIDVNLQVGGRIELHEFDGEGNEISPSVKLEGNRLKGELKKFHLLIAIERK